MRRDTGAYKDTEETKGGGDSTKLLSFIDQMIYEQFVIVVHIVSQCFGFIFIIHAHVCRKIMFSNS